MFLTKSRSVIAFSVALCMVLIASATAAVTGWHGLSQSQRNSAIVNRAQQDLGDYVNMQCKEWVREVVRDASDDAVIIPATRPNGYRWYSHPYIQSYSQGCPPPGVGPGRIIQMVWHNQNGNALPHTAIVLSTTSSGMTWIDCNWNGDGCVRTHYVSYLQFQTSVGTEYTLYRIQ